jgi:hypothetical protein
MLAPQDGLSPGCRSRALVCESLLLEFCTAMLAMLRIAQMPQLRVMRSLRAALLAAPEEQTNTLNNQFASVFEKENKSRNHHA